MKKQIVKTIAVAVLVTVLTGVQAYTHAGYNSTTRNINISADSKSKPCNHCVNLCDGNTNTETALLNSPVDRRYEIRLNRRDIQ